MKRTSISDMLKARRFIVDLIRGDISVVLKSPYPDGAVKVCRNEYEAELYSLNILRQNSIEEEYKGDKPTSMTRLVYGTSDTVLTHEIVDLMNDIKNLYPEKLIWL